MFPVGKNERQGDAGWATGESKLGTIFLLRTLTPCAGDASLSHSLTTQLSGRTGLP